MKKKVLSTISNFENREIFSACESVRLFLRNYYLLLTLKSKSNIEINCAKNELEVINSSSEIYEYISGYQWENLFATSSWLTLLQKLVGLIPQQEEEKRTKLFQNLKVIQGFFPNETKKYLSTFEISTE